MNRRTSALAFAMLLLFSSLGALNTAASDSDSPNVRDSASFPVTIDGLFDDWESIPVVYADPAGDGTDEDFSMLKIANDNDFMFFSIEFHDGEHLMQNWNDIHLYLDTDAEVNTGLPVHGIGAELDWCFGCRSGYFYIMDGIIEISQNDLTLRIAPTITGERFEIAISRSSAILTMDGTQEPTTIKIVLQGGGEAPDILPDEPGGIEYEFDSTPVPSPEIITLEKNEMEHLRILSYNVRQNGLFDSERQAEFERIIKALEPDIMGFQEAYDDNDTNDVNDIEALFEDWFPGVNWHVSSEWNGNFVVSRYPILHQGNHSWRSMGVLLDTEEDLGTPLFFINSHFSCCDANDNRQEQVDELMGFVRDLKNGLGPFTLEYGTPIVHVGDFNLVGYRQQLTTLTDGDIVDEASYGIDFLPDWDDSPLTDLFSRQTHIRMGYTWRIDNSEYNPGKLDYILYTDSVLEPVKHFVLNTLAMSEEDLSFYNLNSEDTKIASDHLPRVMDIAEDSEEPPWVWPDPLPPQDDDIMGNAHLDITGTIASSSNITATWYANVSIRDDYGTDLLANQNLGVRAQIDQHLGDGNGWVSLPEVANFSALVASARNWTDASTGGCCSLDHTAFEAAGGTTVEVFLAVGPVARNMSWGWSETAVLVGQTDGRSTRLLDLPRSGGLIEEVPLTITLPTPWEYRYSAMEDIIEGMPGEFVVNRSAAPVASNIRISLGENEPPGAYGNRLNGGSSSISRDQPTTFEGQCRDSGIETPELKWDVSDNGTIIWTSTEPWISVTPADFNFSHGEVVSVKLTCRDSFSATNIWYDNVVVDAISPTWEASFTGLPPTEDPFAIDASDGIIEIGSEDILEINISALDDSGFDTTIEVTSNRTSEWRHVDWNEMLAQSRFPQGDKVNGLHLDVDSRHEAKPLTTYSLNMTVTDESGNTVQHNWTILVLDGAGPQILPNIYSNGTLIAAEHPARAGAILTVNLTDSYDDLDSILDTRWTFILNQEPIFENKSWTAIEYFDLPPLEAGSHWFIFMAWDSKDNLNLLSFSIAVQPAPGVDIRVWNVSYFGVPIVGETLSVHAIVQNIGGDDATGRLCSGEICSQLVNIPWATATGPGVVGVDLDVPLKRAGELQLRFEWGSSQLNVEGQIDIESNIIVNPNSGPLNIVILVFVVLAGLAWGAHRLWGSERFD